MKRLISGFAVALAGLSGAPAHADVVIGPRVAYYFDNSNLRTSSIEGGQAPEGGLVDEEQLNNVRDGFPGEVEFESQQNGRGIVADQTSFPMIGAMVNFGDDRDRFTITAMYGDGSGGVSETLALGRSLTVQGEQAVDVGSFTSNADFKYDRYDVELSWQRRLNESFALIAGARYERIERAGPGTFQFALTGQVDELLERRDSEVNGNPIPVRPSVPIGVGQPTRQSASAETYSLRAGATAFVPFSDTAVAFFSGLVHASHQPSFENNLELIGLNGERSAVEPTSTDAETSFGPDFAVGIQFILADNLALDMRYRAIMFFPLTGDQSFSDARVNHGVNVGLSLRL